MRHTKQPAHIKRQRGNKDVENVYVYLYRKHTSEQQQKQTSKQPSDRLTNIDEYYTIIYIGNAALHKIRHNQNKIPNSGHKVNWQKQLKTTTVQPPNSFAPNRFEYIYTQLFVAATRAANIPSHLCTHTRARANTQLPPMYAPYIYLQNMYKYIKCMRV